MLTISEFDSMVKEIKNNPKFNRISRSSQKYFEISVDALFATLGGIDDDNVEPYSKEMVNKIFAAKVRNNFSEKNEARVFRLINGFNVLLMHTR